jgi:hypothetical protein
LLTGVESPVRAQSDSEAHQIAAAVKAAPQELREEARVLGYGSDGRLETLREGSNHLICLADDPSDDRLHVACYHESLEPFMARGRQLRQQGRSRTAVDSIRQAEIRSDELTIPDHPAALYSVTVSKERLVASSSPLDALGEASRLHVVYVPYATGESTGLPTRPEGNRPWLMDSGTPWAHIMISTD